MEWFRHDVFARNDIKLRKLARDYGLEGIGAFWIAVEILYAHGGSYPERNLRDELEFFGRDLLDSLVSYDLIAIEDGTVKSKRVSDEIEYQEELRQKRAEAGRLGGLAKSSNAKQVLSNAKQTLANSSKVKQTLAKSSTVTVTDTDNTESSTYKNNLRLISNNTDSCKLAETHDAPAPNKGPEAASPERKTFITIISNTGTEVPIYQDMVDLWTKTYPAVDVKAELQRMKSWSISNPTMRKTWSGMNRFCDNWLKKEQDRSGTKGNAPVRHKDYSDVKPEDFDVKNFRWEV